MRINGLEETECDPEVDRDDMKVSGEVTVEKRSTDRPRAKDEDLCGMSVLCGQAEWRGVFVVDLMDMLVQRAIVQCLVRFGEKENVSRLSQQRKQIQLTEIVERVLEDEKQRNLTSHRFKGRERHLPCGEAEVFCNRVEEPNLPMIIVSE